MDLIVSVPEFSYLPYLLCIQRPPQPTIGRCMFFKGDIFFPQHIL